MSKERAAQLLEAGIWLKLSGDLEGARKLFERALKLDPGNEKATTLLAGGSVPEENLPPVQEQAPVAPAVAPATGNPFERAPQPPGPSELDWGMAAKAPAPPEPTLDGDWGRFTGAATPVPTSPPEASPANSSPPAQPPAPRTTVMFAGSSPSTAGAAPKTTLQFGGSSPSSSVAAPKTTIQFGGSSPSGEVPAPKTTAMFGSPSGITQPPPRATAVFGSPSGGAQPPQSTGLFGSTPSSAPLFDNSNELKVPSGASSPSGLLPAPASTGLFGGAPQPAPRTTMPEFPAAKAVAEAAARLDLSLAADPIASASTGEAQLPGRVADGSLFGAPGELSSEPPAARPSAPAWTWSNSPPAGTQPAEWGEPPPPRPSPHLAPAAESAWDQRSNPGIKLEAVVGRDKALDLISSDSKVTRAPPSKKEEVAAILRSARDLLDLDDHTGAMQMILKAQAIAPDDPDVLAMRERSEKTLLTMLESKLGKLETVPRVLLKDDEIIWLNLDHRAGFVLAQIDGTVSFDDLFSVSGMSRLDTARILAQLIEEGVISRG